MKEVFVSVKTDVNEVPELGLQQSNQYGALLTLLM